MGQTTRSLLLKSLRAQIEAAAAVNDAPLLIRLTRAYNQTVQAAKKPRKTGISPDSQAGKRLAKQNERESRNREARAAYSRAQAVPHTSSPTPVEASVQPVATTAPQATADAIRQAKEDLSQQDGMANYRPQTPVTQTPVTQTRVGVPQGTVGTTTDPIVIAALARIDARVAAEKVAAAKIEAEKIEAAKVEAARIAGSAKSPNPYRPKLGPNPLLPRADYTSEGVGVNSLFERDGCWVEKIIHPSEGRYENLE